jgi:hypothetical protein
MVHPNPGYAGPALTLKLSRAKFACRIIKKCGIGINPGINY